MKKEQLFEAMNEADDKLLERSEKKTNTRIIWLKTISIAACFAIAASFGITYALRPDLPNQPEVTSTGETTLNQPYETANENVVTLPPETIVTEPPVITTEHMVDVNLPKIPYPSLRSVGMGFEGYFAYDVSDIVNANPWSEDWELTTLPVYKNHWVFDEQFRIKEISLEEKEKLLIEIAKRLRLDTHSLEIKNDSINDETIDFYAEKYGGKDKIPANYLEVNDIYTEVDGIKLEVDRKLMGEIWYEPYLKLPEEYKGNSFDGKYDELLKTAEYIKEEYNEIIGMENPQINIYGGDYNINAERKYNLGFFESAEDKVEQIINYNFNNVNYSIRKEGIWIIRFLNHDLSDKLGDYPIYAVAEAKEFLINGKYITTVPEEMPGAEYIKKVELIYRTDNTEEYFMPYYRFYVELPDMKIDHGLKTYGAYYVPAVREEYLTGIPIWDGSFNN